MHTGHAACSFQVDLLQVAVSQREVCVKTAPRKDPQVLQNKSSGSFAGRFALFPASKKKETCLVEVAQDP